MFWLYYINVWLSVKTEHDVWGIVYLEGLMETEGLRWPSHWQTRPQAKSFRSGEGPFRRWRSHRLRVTVSTRPRAVSHTQTIIITYCNWRWFDYVKSSHPCVSARTLSASWTTSTNIDLRSVMLLWCHLLFYDLCLKSVATVQELIIRTQFPVIQLERAVLQYWITGSIAEIWIINTCFLIPGHYSQ